MSNRAVLAGVTGAGGMPGESDPFGESDEFMGKLVHPGFAVTQQQ